MKKITLLIVLSILISSYELSAQIGINSDGSEPDPTAMLDVKSNNKGFLIPRMSQAEIEAITNPANGLMVFNTDDEKLYVYDLVSNQWKELQYGTSTITPPWVCGNQISDIDGNTYNTVLIGTQCWMKENLKTTTYKNGTGITHIPNNATWAAYTSGAYAWYDNNSSWKDIYGAIYNGYAALDANGLCPDGWHVPTLNEWIALTDHIGGTGSPHGNELKSCRQVSSPLGGDCNTSDHPRWNAHGTHYGTDDYGFSALPGGFRWLSGPFYSIGEYGIWWSSTVVGNLLENRDLGYSSGYVHTGGSNLFFGYSVRCIKD